LTYEDGMFLRAALWILCFVGKKGLSFKAGNCKD